MISQKEKPMKLKENGNDLAQHTDSLLLSPLTPKDDEKKTYLFQVSAYDGTTGQSWLYEAENAQQVKDFLNDRSIELEGTEILGIRLVSDDDVRPDRVITEVSTGYISYISADYMKKIVDAQRVIPDDKRDRILSCKKSPKTYLFRVNATNRPDSYFVAKSAQQIIDYLKMNSPVVIDDTLNIAIAVDDIFARCESFVDIPNEETHSMAADEMKDIAEKQKYISAAERAKVLSFNKVTKVAEYVNESANNMTTFYDIENGNIPGKFQKVTLRIDDNSKIAGVQNYNWVSKKEMLTEMENAVKDSSKFLITIRKQYKDPETGHKLFNDKLTFADGVTALENAICGKYGLEYMSDTATISNSELTKLIYEVKDDPAKFLLNDHDYAELTGHVENDEDEDMEKKE